MFADRGGENRIAPIDGVLNVTQNMSEADLMRSAEILLVRQQRILVSVTQSEAWWKRHGQDESDTRALRNPFLPTW